MPDWRHVATLTFSLYCHLQYEHVLVILKVLFTHKHALILDCERTCIKRRLLCDLTKHVVRVARSGGWSWLLGNHQRGGGASWAANNRSLFSAHSWVDVTVAVGRQQSAAFLCRGITFTTFCFGLLSQRHLYNCTKITEIPQQCPYFHASNNVSCRSKLWCVLFGNSFTSRTGKVKTERLMMGLTANTNMWLL